MINNSNSFLSIQSHVARDYVGNKAAVFPLQRMGHTVDFINTVEFSSMFVHNGPLLKGQYMEEILNGLLIAHLNPRGGGHPGSATRSLQEIICKDNEVYTLEMGASRIGSPYSTIITGYMPDTEVLYKTISFIKGLKSPQITSNKDDSSMSMQSNGKEPNKYTQAHNTSEIAPSSQTANKNSPEVNILLEEDSTIASSNTNIPFWLCDTVLGDNGALYVGHEMVKAYETMALPLADLITPNQFEAEILSSSKICSISDVASVCKILHNKGPSYIVITSCCFTFDQDNLYMICSQSSNGISNCNLSHINSNNTQQDKNSTSQQIKTEQHQNDTSSTNSSIHFIKFQKRPTYIGGTGDLLTSVLSSQIQKHSFTKACEISLSIVQEVISYTLEKDEKATSVNVVGSQKSFENFKNNYQCVDFTTLLSSTYN